MRMNRILLALLLASAAPVAVAADDPVAQQMKTLTDQINQMMNMMKDLQSTVKKQSERIDSLEKENATLKSQQPSPAPTPTAVPPAAPSTATPPPAAAPAPTAAPAPAPGPGQLKVEPAPWPSPTSASGSSAAGRGGFTPDIGAVVDITGNVSQHKIEDGDNQISMRELELVIGHDIDPYARFDATLSFGQNGGFDVEEAYVTYWEVPGGFQFRLGRMRPKVGKESALHTDQLDTVDMPLVIQRYLGDEGLFRTGVEVSHSIPQFAKVLTQDVTFGVLEGGVGDGGTLFSDTPTHPTFYAHLKNSFDINQTTSLEAGGTYLIGSSEESNYDVQAIGGDLTFMHYFTPIRKLKWQSEFYKQFRGDSAENDGAYGLYSLLDLRLTERWGVGVRYDWVQLVNGDAVTGEDIERAYSAYVTFFQSEFARIRFQYQLADLTASSLNNRFFLQTTFAVGAHKHKLQ